MNLIKNTFCVFLFAVSCMGVSLKANDELMNCEELMRTGTRHLHLSPEREAALLTRCLVDRQPICRNSWHINAWHAAVSGTAGLALGAIWMWTRK